MTILNVIPGAGAGPPFTSGTWTFSVMRDDIIRHAMLDIGALDGEEVPTAQEITDCAFRLNMIVKQWMGNMDFAHGLKMWQRQRGALFLSPNKYMYNLGPTGDNWAGGSTILFAPTLFGTDQLIAAAPVNTTSLNVGIGSTGNYYPNDFIGVQMTNGDLFWSTIASIQPSLGLVILASPLTPVGAASGAYVFNYSFKAQRPIEIVTCILRDVNGVDTPLTRMTLQTYEALPTKTTVNYLSDPSAWYYESQLGNGNFYLDVGGAQDVTKHLHVVYLRESMDFDNPTDAPEYPKQWFRALHWELGRDICSMFDGVWTEDCKDSHAAALAQAGEQDAETTEIYFQTSTDSVYGP